MYILVVLTLAKSKNSSWKRYAWICKSILTESSGVIEKYELSESLVKKFSHASLPRERFASDLSADDGVEVWTHQFKKIFLFKNVHPLRFQIKSFIFQKLRFYNNVDVTLKQTKSYNITWAKFNKNIHEHHTFDFTAPTIVRVRFKASLLSVFLD